VPGALPAEQAHAEFQATPDGKVVLRDVGSKTKTYLNKRKKKHILEPNQDKELTDGQTIFFGRIQCVFKCIALPAGDSNAPLATPAAAALAPAGGAATPTAAREAPAPAPAPASTPATAAVATAAAIPSSTAAPSTAARAEAATAPPAGTKGGNNEDSDNLMSTDDEAGDDPDPTPAARGTAPPPFARQDTAPEFEAAPAAPSPASGSGPSKPTVVLSGKKRAAPLRQTKVRSRCESEKTVVWWRVGLARVCGFGAAARRWYKHYHYNVGPRAGCYDDFARTRTYPRALRPLTYL